MIKKVYIKPRLTDYGKVANLTRNGTSYSGGVGRRDDDRRGGHHHRD